MLRHVTADAEFSGMDHDHYEFAVTFGCMRNSSSDAAAGARRAEQYRRAFMNGPGPFNLKAGQLTIYRSRYCTFKYCTTLL